MPNLQIIESSNTHYKITMFKMIKDIIETMRKEQDTIKKRPSSSERKF